MKTTVITARVSDQVLTELDGLCARMDRSRAWVVAKAVEAYLDDERAFTAFVAEGDACFDRGDVVTQEQMEGWVAERYRNADAA